MPKFSKSALSQFLKTDCRRQLKLHMSKGRAAEILAAGMPPSQPARPGFSDVTEAGDEWEVRKLTELRDHFGEEALRGRGNLRQHDDGPRFEYEAVYLTADMMSAVQPGQLLVQPRFVIESADFPDGTTYGRHSGLHALREPFGLEVSDVIPDLIQVMPPGRYAKRVLPTGDVETLAPGDTRLQLRIIDIKMTSEPGAGYFAEVTYYSMALAGWLEDTLDAPGGRALSEQFAVVPQAAIWPGSHEASALVKLLRAADERGVAVSMADKLKTWESELEETEFDVFRFRVDQVIREVVPAVLAARWENLPFHVTTSCKNCDYLGYPWVRADGSHTWDERHCWPTGERDGGHLSRIPGISRGATETLAEHGHYSVQQVAALPQTADAFDRHQSLRVGRTVIGARAASLRDGTTGIAPDAATSASMPRFVNLRLFITASFDISSALTLSLGVSGSLLANVWNGGDDRLSKQFRTEVRVSEFRDTDVEFRALRNFLGHINSILRDVDLQAWEDRNRGPLVKGRPAPNQCRMQVYVWDQLTYEHLCRIVGRHLTRLIALDGVKNLAWLFPPEELLPDPGHASRASPITIVESVVRASVAAPIPHHYSLLGVARAYHPARIENATGMLSVHPMFEDKLSDQVPSERAVQIWARKAGWERTIADLLRTVERQHVALSLIVERLETDLRLESANMTAPLIAIGPPERQDRMSLDGHLWLTFARLNYATMAQEREDIRAMPVYEREARGKSAVLTNRLTGIAEREALQELQLPPKTVRRVYHLSPKSTDVSLREGDMGFALAPASQPGFLNKSFNALALSAGIAVDWNRGQGHWKMADALAVTPVRIDRERRLLVLDETPMRPGILDELEGAQLVDLGRDVMLDPIATDHFTKKLRDVLLKVGRPREAVNSALVLQATGQEPVIPGKFSTSSPLSRFLWLAEAEARVRTPEPAPAILERLARSGIGLNPSQLQALNDCLSSRLHLVWGPPGTGKSHTLAATVAAALLQARVDGRGLRVLVTAFTWSAIDNLMPSISENATKVLGDDVDIVRLASRSTIPILPEDYPRDIVTVLDRSLPSDAILSLKAQLRENDGQELVVVGSTPSQVVNLMRTGGDRYAEELFDLIVIDEGSQLDVAQATLAVAALSAGGCVICAGDPLQMAPIHPIEAPSGLEDMVGSVYLFMKNIHHVPETQLTLNYRSNIEIVDCFRHAGYGERLDANARGLRLRFSSTLRAGCEEWTPPMPWSETLDAIIDFAMPVTCVVHSDSMSAQSSEFEAQLVVAAVWRLWTCMLPGLDGEVGHDGVLKPPPAVVPLDPADFWGCRIGIVTPHRAQGGMVVAGLVRLFGPLGHDANQIRKAVDTVERFQGQERDVIIASYAVGDPDTVADEEEFLHSLNRFNVMASRARAKLIILATEQLVSHLSDDIKVVRQSRLLKYIVEGHCGTRQPLSLPWRKADGTMSEKSVSLRYP